MIYGTTNGFRDANLLWLVRDLLGPDIPNHIDSLIFLHRANCILEYASVSSC